MFMSVLNIGLTIYSLFKKYGESGVSAFFSWDAIKSIFFIFLFTGVIYLYGPKFDHTDPETIEKLKNNPFIKFWKRIQVLIMFIYGFLAVYTVVITIFPFIIMIPVIGQIIMFIGGFLGLFF